MENNLITLHSKKMSKWLFVWSIIFQFQIVYSQCLTPAQVTYGDLTNCSCNEAPNMDHIRVYDDFCLRAIFPGNMNSILTFGDVTVNFYENNTLIHSVVLTYPYDAYFLSHILYKHRVETPGTYVYKTEIVFDYAGCTGFFNERTIQIYERECPFIGLTVADMSPCLPPENDIELTLELSDNSATILNTTWEFVRCDSAATGSNNEVGVYTSQGVEFTFTPPYPGSFCGTATSQIMLSDGTVCLANANGGDCQFSTGGWLYSDPFFELGGILQSGNDIDVVFKGTQIYPLNNNHRYYLYHNSTLIATVDNLQFDQVIATLNSISPGNHVLKLVGEADKVCMDEYSYEFRVADEQAEVPCESCNTFRPQPGERYWVSAWVKENQSSQVKTYTNPRLEFGFTGSGVAAAPFYPSGDIVEGWQRIVGSFTIPANTTALNIKLVNGHPSMEVYFDDIRIHPYNANMKSYVYDPATYLLSAELDDNNYATFYEYDKEGLLIRIKKETARGIMTIQESRSSNPKR